MQGVLEGALRLGVAEAPAAQRDRIDEGVAAGVGGCSLG